jgi:hypothetical protein
MRRNAAGFTLLILVAPLAARFAASSSDAEVARCALACARATMGGEKAACCPTGHGAAGPTLSSCSQEGDAAPLPAAGVALLASALLLTLPSMTQRRALVPVLAFPFPPSRVPDKVPLLLG